MLEAIHLTMRVVRIVMAAMVALIGGVMVAVVISWIVTHGYLFSGLKDLWPGKSETTTTLPHFDSGNLRVNEYGASDQNGQFSYQPGTHPGAMNIVPVIP